MRLEGRDVMLRKSSTVIENIKDGCKSAQIIKITGITQAQTCKLITDFERMGLLRTERAGRDKKLYLTEKGIIAQRYVKGLAEVLE